MGHDKNYANDAFKVKEEQTSPQQTPLASPTLEPVVVSSPTPFVQTSVPTTPLQLFPTGATALVPAPPVYEVIQNRIFVGGYPQTTNESELREHFEKFYPVKDVKMIKSLDGSSKGYGFVTFETEDQAEAIRKLDPKQLEFRNRNLNLGPALRKLGTSPYTTGYNVGNGQVIAPSAIIPASPATVGYIAHNQVFVFPSQPSDGLTSPKVTSPVSTNQFFVTNDGPTPLKSYANAVAGGTPTPLMSTEPGKPLENVTNTVNNPRSNPQNGYHYGYNYSKSGHFANNNNSDSENVPNFYQGQSQSGNMQNVETNMQHSVYYPQPYYYPQNGMYPQWSMYPYYPQPMYIQQQMGYRPSPPPLLGPGSYQYSSNNSGSNGGSFDYSSNYSYPQSYGGYGGNGYGHNNENAHDSGRPRRQKLRKESESNDKLTKTGGNSQKIGRTDKRPWKESSKIVLEDPTKKLQQNRTKSTSSVTAEMKNLTITKEEKEIKKEIKQE